MKMRPLLLFFFISQAGFAQKQLRLTELFYLKNLSEPALTYQMLKTGYKIIHRFKDSVNKASFIDFRDSNKQELHKALEEDMNEVIWETSLPLNLNSFRKELIKRGYTLRYTDNNGDRINEYYDKRLNSVNLNYSIKHTVGELPLYSVQITESLQGSAVIPAQ